MEEKKLDINSIIGFVLIAGILLFMLWQNQPTPEELEAQEKAKQEQVESEETQEVKADAIVTSSEDYSVNPNDSTQMANLQTQIGDFAYSASLATDKTETVIENEVLSIKVNHKGGYISEVRLKNFVDYDSVPVYLIKDQNSIFNINFGTADNRILNTQDLVFQPSLTKSGDNQVLSMKLKVSV